MSESTNGKVLTLICERACDLSAHLDDKSRLKDEPAVQVVKFPCSGMIQPLMVEAAFKAGATGVIVTGCQIGDCYYREGNRMIRERLLGERPPGLKKTVDRRRVIGLWLSKPQAGRFISEAKEFLAQVKELGPVAAEPAKPAPAPKPAAPAAKKEEAPAAPAKEDKPAEPKEEKKSEPKDKKEKEPKAEEKAESKEDKPEAKTEEPKEEK